MKKTYISPRMLQTMSVSLEDRLMFGSIVDFIYPVETFGAEVDSMFDYSLTSEDTFNHHWEE